MMKKPANAFTLIELLVTISVLAILAALTYNIIDVKGVRNRARDSNTVTAVNKMSLSLEAYVSSHGEAPPAHKIVDLIQGVTTQAGCNEATNDVYCVFEVDGFELPSTCNSSGIQGLESSGDSGQCYFYYYGPDTSDTMNYALLGKSWGLTDTLLGISANLGSIECTSPFPALNDPRIGTNCSEVAD